MTALFSSFRGVYGHENDPQGEKLWGGQSTSVNFPTRRGDFSFVDQIFASIHNTGRRERRLSPKQPYFIPKFSKEAYQYHFVPEANIFPKLSYAMNELALLLSRHYQKACLFCSDASRQ